MRRVRFTLGEFKVYLKSLGELKFTLGDIAFTLGHYCNSGILTFCFCLIWGFSISLGWGGPIGFGEKI